MWLMGAQRPPYISLKFMYTITGSTLAYKAKWPFIQGQGLCWDT